MKWDTFAEEYNVEYKNSPVPGLKMVTTQQVKRKDLG